MALYIRRKTNVLARTRACLVSLHDRLTPSLLSTFLYSLVCLRHSFIRLFVRPSTNDLFDNDQFKTDPRFLRVWIQYADLVREPEDIFRFLQVHSIGQDFALFYEAYALFLEKRGAHKDAMGVYELGIGRFAFPVERLRKKLTDFHKRMARRAARDARRATPMSISRSEQSIPSRAALSSLRSASGFGAMGTAPSAAFGGGSGGGGGGNENAGEGLCVYTDTPTHEVGSHGAAALSSLQRQVASDWTRVGSQRVVSKENEGMADKWSDYSIAPGTAGRPPPNQTAQADAFSVLVDEEFVEPAPFAAAGQQQGVRGAVEGKQRGGRAKTKPSVSVLAFSEELSKDACGEDVSFEELRAMRYATNRPHKTHTTTGEGGNEGGEVSCAPPPAGNARAAAEAETAAEAPGAASPAEPSVRCVRSVGGVCLDDPGTGPLDDVTLCTKEAFATIDAMFTTQSGCVARPKPARLENGRPVAAHEGDTAPLDTPLVMSRVSQRLDFEDRNLEVSVYEDTTLLPSDTADIILGRQGAAGLGAGTEAGEGGGREGGQGNPTTRRTRAVWGWRAPVLVTCQPLQPQCLFWRPRGALAGFCLTTTTTFLSGTRTFSSFPRTASSPFAWKRRKTLAFLKTPWASNKGRGLTGGTTGTV